MKLHTLDCETVIGINQMVCREGDNPFHCFDPGKVESALHSAFYPGDPPFAHGGVGRIAGAIAFYLCQAHAFQDGNKRTASLAAIVFLNANNMDLRYPESQARDDFSDLIIAIASGNCDIEKAKDWFEVHRYYLE